MGDMASPHGSQSPFVDAKDRVRIRAALPDLLCPPSREVSPTCEDRIAFMTQSIEDYEKLRIPSVITLLTGRLDGFVVGSSQWREDKEVKGEPVDDTDAEEEQIFLNAIRAMYASDEDEEVARLRFEESQGGPGREPLSSRRYPIRLKRKQPSSGSSHRAAKDDGTPLERRRNSAKRTRIDGQYTGSSVVANSLNSGRTTVGPLSSPLVAREGLAGRMNLPASVSRVSPEELLSRPLISRQVIDSYVTPRAPTVSTSTTVSQPPKRPTPNFGLSSPLSSPPTSSQIGRVVNLSGRTSTTPKPAPRNMQTLDEMVMASAQKRKASQTLRTPRSSREMSSRLTPPGSSTPTHNPSGSSSRMDEAVDALPDLQLATPSPPHPPPSSSAPSSEKSFRLQPLRLQPTFRTLRGDSQDKPPRMGVQSQSSSASLTGHAVYQSQFDVDGHFGIIDQFLLTDVMD